MKSVLALDLGTNFDSPFGKTQSLGSLLSTVMNVGLVVGSVILLFLLIGGGLQIIAGAGNSDPKATAGGKQAVTWALIGFLIIFATYWLIRFLEIITGVNFVTGPTFSGGS